MSCITPAIEYDNRKITFLYIIKRRNWIIASLWHNIKASSTKIEIRIVTSCLVMPDVNSSVRGTIHIEAFNISNEW
jgi:hypothetical protein